MTSYKEFLNVWATYKHPENKLILNLNEQNIIEVLEPISREVIITFTSKIKIKVLRLLLDTLGFIKND